MCFCAGASFSVAGMLIIIGTLTLNKIRSKKELPLSLIPYFFAIQQILEGFLWLGLQGHHLISKFNSILTFSYLFFALPFWPIWLPLSVFLLETDKKRKKYILLTLIIGIGVSIHTAFLIVFYGVKSEIISNHIFYHTKASNATYLAFSLYLIATILPFFISSIPLLWIFGTLGLIFLYISYYFYVNFLLSVWCFFAAMLSVFIYFIIRKQ